MPYEYFIGLRWHADLAGIQLQLQPQQHISVRLDKWLTAGRHFASAEILTFIAAFISLADVKVISDSIQVNTQRQGLGVLQPKGKMVVKMTRLSDEI